MPFYGGFGLIAAGGIPKPAYNAFKLFHQFGNQRLPVSSDFALVTRRRDGSLALAVWNLFSPEEQGGAPKTVTLNFKGLADGKRAYISRVDSQHGDPHPAYEKMGSPRYPTQAQLKELRKAATLPAPEEQELRNNQLTLTLPVNGLAFITIQ